MEDIYFLVKELGYTGNNNRNEILNWLNFKFIDVNYPRSNYSILNKLKKVIFNLGYNIFIVKFNEPKLEQKGFCIMTEPELNLWKHNVNSCLDLMYKEGNFFRLWDDKSNYSEEYPNKKKVLDLFTITRIKLHEAHVIMKYFNKQSGFPLIDY